jgi:hypothetical protein
MKMAKIYVSSVIDAPIDKVWGVVRDFNGLPNWLPRFSDSHIEGGLPADAVGCVRNFNLKEGGNIRERLLALSDAEHFCTYGILSAPLPVENYVATLRLRSVTDGNRTFAEWSAEFDSPQPKEMIEAIGNGVFQAGFDALKQRFKR